MAVTTKSGPSTIAPADYYEFGPEFNVGSWSPGELAEHMPATQVHLVIGTAPGRCAVVRFKGPDSLDALIDALVEHREYTFGKRADTGALAEVQAREVKLRAALSEARVPVATRVADEGDATSKAALASVDAALALKTDGAALVETCARIGLGCFERGRELGWERGANSTLPYQMLVDFEIKRVLGGVK